jgi:hypothetical protein
MSDKGQQVPSVGRVVHFMYGDQHVPAIIVVPKTNEPDEVGLFVMTMDTQFTAYALYSENPKQATWHWPEYVPTVKPPKGS